MQSRTPFATFPIRGAGISTVRGVFALLLALFVSAVVDAQPPKTDPKADPEKKDTKPPEPKWPTDINGKDLKAFMKDLEDPDPVNREYAARTLPSFGPPAQKGDVSKLLLKRMTLEPDPGVRYAVWGAVGAIAFDSENDNKEAVRLLAGFVDSSANGSAARLNAVQTIGMFGPKGEGAITALTGQAMNDPSYETRRSIANALGRVGFNEVTGPNMKALTALADRSAKDVSAAVRMEALQSLLLLGPPWDSIKKPDAKVPPPINKKSSEVIIKYMKVRVGDPKAKIAGIEKDKQVEIWARLVLMRFDPTEVNDDNLDAFGRYLTGNEVGVKIQALQALAMLGEFAGKKVDAVARLLGDKDAPIQLTVQTIQVLMAMGYTAKPALPDLRKLMDETKKGLEKKKGQDKQNDEDLVKLIEAAIKRIEEAKPTSPAVEPKK